LRTETDVSQDRLLRAKAAASFAGFAYKAVLGIVGLAVIAGAAYVLMPAANKAPVPPKPEFPDQLTSYKSEITGVDAKDLPFQINADKSVQDDEKRNLVHLETVGGIFDRAEGKKYNVSSEKALYDRDSKQLTLEGKVKITNLPRMVAEMDKAEVDTVKRSLVSKSPVQVTLENGFVTADELRADNNGERLLFKGRVKAKFKN
jgi:LPS export ABC transporter protein LptC